MSALGSLVALRFRRDRLQLTVWLLSILVLALIASSAISKTYGTEAERITAVKLIVINPSLIALRGAPQGASIGAFLVLEIIAYLALLAAFMSTFMAVRHSRADEESGRAELIASTRAGRLAPTVATVIEGFVANVGVALATVLGFSAIGLDLGGSIVAGLGVGACGFAFLGVGLACAQFFSTSRTANGWAATLVMVAFVLRALGDGAGTRSADGLFVTPAFASWLSPIGWSQLTHPYTANNAGPILLGLGLGIVLVAGTLLLQSVRDNGEGIVAARGGRPTAGPTLGGPVGLAWRLQRGSIIGWGLGAIVLTALVAGIGPSAVKTIGSDKSVGSLIQQLVPGGTGGLLDIFIAAIAAIIGLVVAGFALQTVMRLRQEEASGTAEAVLSTRVGRLRWYLSFIGLAVVFSAVILVLCGLVGGAAAAGAGQHDAYSAWMGACLSQLPAVLVYPTILGLVFTLVPRATVGVGWAMLALGAFLGTFGALFKLPQWMRDISPSTHSPVLPGPNADWSGAWVMLAICAAAVIVACVTVRQRDVAIG
jgi:ABC-2 type transport system permease protein